MFVGSIVCMSELIVLYLFVFLLILVALAIATCLGVSRLEAAHPPTGEFVDVEGVRLHVVTLGLAPDNPHAEPAIVLIHGASGNLQGERDPVRLERRAIEIMSGHAANSTET